MVSGFALWQRDSGSTQFRSPEVCKEGSVSEQVLILNHSRQETEGVLRRASLFPLDC